MKRAAVWAVSLAALRKAFLRRMQMGWTSSDMRIARLKRWPTMRRPHSSTLLKFSIQRGLSWSDWDVPDSPMHTFLVGANMGVKRLFLSATLTRYPAFS